MSNDKPRSIRREDALAYHEFPRPGKVEVTPTKPLSTQYDLALAYSPGVAEPCRAIVANADDDFEHYETELLARVGIGQKLVSGIIHRARASRSPRPTTTRSSRQRISRATSVSPNRSSSAPRRRFAR